MNDTPAAESGQDAFEEAVQKLAALLIDIDRSGLHLGSVMAEAEDRLMTTHDRVPVLSTSGGASLVTYSLDTQGLRWWLRGTPASAPLARISDERLLELAERGDNAREAALGKLDDYADWLGQAVTDSADLGDLPPRDD